jgi:hypothetical protein
VFGWNLVRFCCRRRQRACRDSAADKSLTEMTRMREAFVRSTSKHPEKESA